MDVMCDITGISIESVKTMSMYNESAIVLCKDKKNYLRHENNVNENKVLFYFEALRYK